MVKVCQNCGKEIQDNRNYETHVLRCVFNRIKSLECDHCGKCYSYRSSLYLHQKTCIPGFADKTSVAAQNDDVNEASGSSESKGKTRRKRQRNNSKTILVHNVVLKGDSPTEKSNTVRKSVNDESPSHKRFKYEMCLLTKTLKLIESDNEHEDVQKEDTTNYEHIDVVNENEIGPGEDENVIIIPNIEDLHDYDDSEVIVEEITLPDVIEEESTTYDEGEAVVVIEDFEFFNKIEVRKDNSDTEILEFEEC